MGGQSGLPLSSGEVDAADRQRVDWRFEASTGRLTRRAWPTLYPANARQIGPEMTALTGVTSLSLRSFWTGRGWVQGLRPPGGSQSSERSASGDGDSEGVAPETYSSTLPIAMEVTLETRDYGRIVLVEYLQ